MTEIKSESVAEPVELPEDAHTCSRCGKSVSVPDGLEFNGDDGDMCWACTAVTNEAELKAAREEIEKLKIKVEAGIEAGSDLMAHLVEAEAKLTALRKNHAENQKQIINSLLIRLTNRLVDMRPEYDDSITGFNEAMDIVRDALVNPVKFNYRAEAVGKKES